MDSIGLKEEDVYFGRLTHKADLISDVREFAIKNKIHSGFFTAIGAVENAVLAFYRQEEKKYVEEEFNEPLELVSCLGNVALKDNKLFVHAHACLSREDKSTIGGHLVSARVFAGEVHFFTFADKLERKFDEQTGLSLIGL